MNASSISLPQLPAIVLDEILRYLKRRDLHALSSVSKTLNYVANRYLYLRVTNYKASRALIGTSLRANPDNAAHIRFFTSYDQSLLTFLWQRMRLKLYGLRLDWSEDNTDQNPYAPWIDTVYSRSRVRKLIFPLKTDNELYLLQHLCMLDGLTELELNIEATNLFTPQIVLDNLNYPTLRHIRIRNVSTCVVQLGVRFPRLQSLELFGSVVDQEMQGPTETLWETLSVLMEKSVFYQVVVHGRCISFLEHVLSHAFRNNRDPALLVRWLFRCSHYFGGDDFVVEIPELPVSLLIETLDATKSLEFDGSEMTVCLPLPGDTPNSISGLLNENITELQIEPLAGQVVSPTVVPRCISSLARLKRLTLNLLYHQSPRRQSNCTTSSCSFPEWFAPVYSAKLLVTEYGPLWYISHGAATIYFDQIRVLGGFDVSAFEEEVKSWLGLSPSLEIIEINFEHENDRTGTDPLRNSI